MSGKRQRASWILVAVVAAWVTVLPSAEATAATTSAGSGRGPASGGAWGKAEMVPGSGRDAVLFSVSCASAGDCSAGGFYTGKSEDAQAFVVSQVNGVWHKAVEVPGTAALNRGTAFGAAVNSVSCASAGDCSAGGSYTDKSGNQQAFVVSQVKGTWGKAEEVPGTAALNKNSNPNDPGAAITSVSCASAGDCSAGGLYTDAAGTQAFVVSQVNGVWHKAVEVPGTAALDTGGNARKGTGAIVTSVSCGSPGDCGAGGGYTDRSKHGQAFVVTQVNGTWGKAEEVPATAALNTGGDAAITSVSCASPGHCGAGGVYTNASGSQAFVASQVNNSWGKAEEVPGTAALNAGGETSNSISVSCASPGDCSAGGSYSDKSGNQQAFVVNQVGGTWHTAEEVPGSAALNTGGGAAVISVSCPPAGRCSAGGLYANKATTGQQAFVVSQV